MLLRDDTAYPLGTRMDFELPLPGEREPLRGEAEVVRHTVPDVEGLQGIGVRFVALKGDGNLRLKRVLGTKSAR
jgi:hypothetical protein